MDSFNKRSADIFGALDRLEPPKSKEKDKSASDGDFKRPHGIYTPPSKRAKVNRSDTRTHSRNSCETDEPTHHDYHGHSSTRHRYHETSHDSRRKGSHSHKDPSKWTKYDLKDDGTKQLSGLSDEQINRQVAYKFLNQIKERNQPKCEEPPDSDKKIVFKKPSRLHENSKDTKSIPKKLSQNAEDSTADFGKPTMSLRDSESYLVGGSEGGSGNVKVMPEYVVGVTSRGRRKRSLKPVSSKETKSEDGCGSDAPTTKRSKIKSAVRSEQSTSVVLSHLEDCDD